MIEGHDFSITYLVASGVTSLSVSPVPPVVKTRSMSSQSVNSQIQLAIASISSGTILDSFTSY